MQVEMIQDISSSPTKVDLSPTEFKLRVSVFKKL